MKKSILFISLSIFLLVAISAVAIDFSDFKIQYIEIKQSTFRWARDLVADPYDPIKLMFVEPKTDDEATQRFSWAQSSLDFIEKMPKGHTLGLTSQNGSAIFIFERIRNSQSK